MIDGRNSFVFGPLVNIEATVSFRRRAPVPQLWGNSTSW
jgi:hypothetical protein